MANKTACPLGFTRCSHTGQPTDCTLCGGCQCRNKYPHMCRGRSGMAFYQTRAEKAQLSALAREQGDFPAALVQRIVSEWLRVHT